MNATLHAPSFTESPLIPDFEVETSLTGIGRVVVGFNCAERGLTLAHRDGYEVIEHPAFHVITVRQNDTPVAYGPTHTAELQSVLYAFARRNGPNDPDWFDIAD